MAKASTVLSYAQAGLTPRTLMLGIRAFSASRAFSYTAVLRAMLIQDRIGSEPILLVVGVDDRSVRVFRQRIPRNSGTPQFYRISSADAQGNRTKSPALLMDAQSGSEWNFEGCAIAEKLKGVCLDSVNVIKDYWFDWRNYNAETTVYGIKQKTR